MRKCGCESANGEVPVFLARCFVGIDGLEGFDDVGVRKFAVTGGLGGVCDGQVQFLGILLVEFPGGEPVGELRG